MARFSSPSPYQTPSTRRAPNRSRDLVALLVAVVIGAAALGGGYILADRVNLPGIAALPFVDPTKAPPIASIDALKQIQAIDPTARVSVSSPLNDEVDLIITHDGQIGSNYTPQEVTKILSLYMRGYSKQPFWRWIDKYPTSSSQRTFEMHTKELWRVDASTIACLTQWTVYNITPDEIIKRGITGGNYSDGVSSHPGDGTPPANDPGCHIPTPTVR